MNHQVHWHNDPIRLSRLGDQRLRRYYIHKTKWGSWETLYQTRNDAAHNWGTKDWYHYELFEQARTFVELNVTYGKGKW